MRLPHGLEGHQWVPLEVVEHVTQAEINKEYDDHERRLELARERMQSDQLNALAYVLYQPRYYPPVPSRYILQSCPCGDWRLIKMEHMDGHIEVPS